MIKTDRLVLGTAQLGMPYGIANRRGQPDQETAKSILMSAWKYGIRTLDTAQAYGVSETTIGNFLNTHPECHFEVISKLDPDVDFNSADAIRTAVRQSKKRLGHVPAGMMLHNATQLTHWDSTLGQALIEMKEQGEIGCLGISVYHPNEFLQALEHPEITWIQAPFNVFDQRLLTQNLLAEAERKKKRVFLRSIFLQGLLLMEPGALPPETVVASTALKNWQELCQRHAIHPQKAALVYALNSAPNASIVMGCETTEQIEENMEAVRMIQANEDFVFEAKALRTENPKIINPSTWH